MNRWHLTAAIPPVLQTITGKAAYATKAIAPSPTQSLSDLLPYYLVHAIPGVSYSGGWDGGYPVADMTYQVTSVARSEEQADWMASRAHNAMLDPSTVITSDLMAVDPLKVILVSPNAQDGAIEGSDGVVSIAERFTISVTER